MSKKIAFYTMLAISPALLISTHSYGATTVLGTIDLTNLKGPQGASCSVSEPTQVANGQQLTITCGTDERTVTIPNGAAGAPGDGCSVEQLTRNEGDTAQHVKITCGNAETTVEIPDGTVGCTPTYAKTYINRTNDETTYNNAERSGNTIGERITLSGCNLENDVHLDSYDGADGGQGDQGCSIEVSSVLDRMVDNKKVGKTIVLHSTCDGSNTTNDQEVHIDDGAACQSKIVSERCGGTGEAQCYDTTKKGLQITAYKCDGITVDTTSYTYDGDDGHDFDPCNGSTLSTVVKSSSRSYSMGTAVSGKTYYSTPGGITETRTMCDNNPGATFTTPDTCVEVARGDSGCAAPNVYKQCKNASNSEVYYVCEAGTSILDVATAAQTTADSKIDSNTMNSAISAATSAETLGETLKNTFATTTQLGAANSAITALQTGKVETSTLSNYYNKTEVDEAITNAELGDLNEDAVRDIVQQAMGDTSAFVTTTTYNNYVATNNAAVASKLDTDDLATELGKTDPTNAINSIISSNSTVTGKADSSTLNNYLQTANLATELDKPANTNKVKSIIANDSTVAKTSDLSGYATTNALNAVQATANAALPAADFGNILKSQVQAANVAAAVNGSGILTNYATKEEVAAATMCNGTIRTENNSGRISVICDEAE